MRPIADVLADYALALPTDYIVVGLVVSPDGSTLGITALNPYETSFLDYWSFVFRFPAPPACVADLNGDGATNVLDFSAFVSAFGTNLGDPGYLPAADFDQSGTIDVLDFAVFLGDFGCPVALPS
jgi:hypothetical protein